MCLCYDFPFVGRERRENCLWEMQREGDIQGCEIGPLHPSHADNFSSM